MTRFIKNEEKVWRDTLPGKHRGGKEALEKKPNIIYTEYGKWKHSKKPLYMQQNG